MLVQAEHDQQGTTNRIGNLTERMIKSGEHLPCLATKAAEFMLARLSHSGVAENSTGSSDNEDFKVSCFGGRQRWQNSPERKPDVLISLAIPPLQSPPL